jgi:hypothetical protein
MPGKWLTLVIIGAAFVVLGIFAIFLGIREEKRIFAALAKKPDLREFAGRHVESPQPGALKIGGWIAIALGVILAVVAIIFWRTGWPMD